MYTVTSITVISDSEKRAQGAIDSAYREIDRLEKLLNFYSRESEVSLINDNAGIMPVRVSQDTLDVIEKAIYTSEMTGGAFDITVGPVVKLWDFQSRVVPDEKTISEKAKLTGYRNIVLDKTGGTVFLSTRGMQIDLGALVKGYAADRAVEILKSNGITSGIVTIGGEVKAFGTRPGGDQWNVGIQNPRPVKNVENLVPPNPPSEKRGDGEVSDQILATIKLSDRAISTSGDYEKFFVKEGKWYHHIFDPKTGHPVYECQSVTIVAKDAVFTDAFATGIFVLGPERGLEVLKRVGFDGVIVDKNGTIHMTDGLQGKVKFLGREK